MTFAKQNAEEVQPKAKAFIRLHFANPLNLLFKSR
jgi:hypothetical protein